MKIKDNRIGEVKLNELKDGDFFEYLNKKYLMIGVNAVYDGGGMWIDGESLVFDIESNISAELENDLKVMKLNAYIVID